MYRDINAAEVPVPHWLKVAKQLDKVEFKLNILVDCPEFITPVLCKSLRVIFSVVFMVPHLRFFDFLTFSKPQLLYLRHPSAWMVPWAAAVSLGIPRHVRLTSFSVDEMSRFV